MFALVEGQKYGWTSAAILGLFAGAVVASGVFTLAFGLGWMAGMPAMARALTETIFRGWFTDAVASTFIVALILAISGGLCAFLLRRNVMEESVATQTDAPTGSAEDAAVVQADNA